MICFIFDYYGLYCEPWSKNHNRIAILRYFITLVYEMISNKYTDRRHFIFP